VYEPGSYVPLARLDARGEKTEQGGLGTQDDEQLKTEEQTPAKPTQPRYASEAERRYWASLEATSQPRAQELEIKGWGTGTDGPAKAKICDVYYFHTDQVGLPEELSNDQGNLVWRASYKTWGNTVSEDWSVVSLYGAKVDESYRGDTPKGDAKQQNLRFQGQYLDRDTGLHYNTFRYYDPDIGRFISPDPIGLAGGVNLGSYSPNPISWIDPWGWCGHGNSKTSTKAQHGYEIIDTRTGQVVKTGVSGGKIRADGKSYRAEKQVRDWNKEVGEGAYESRTVKHEPAGQNAREKILEWEKQNADNNRGTLDPERHKIP
jgi:RHS repeat-associated protein